MFRSEVHSSVDRRGHASQRCKESIAVGRWEKEADIWEVIVAYSAYYVKFACYLSCEYTMHKFDELEYPTAFGTRRIYGDIELVTSWDMGECKLQYSSTNKSSHSTIKFRQCKYSMWLTQCCAELVIKPSLIESILCYILPLAATFNGLDAFPLCADIKIFDSDGCIEAQIDDPLPPSAAALLSMNGVFALGRGVVARSESSSRWRCMRKKIWLSWAEDCCRMVIDGERTGVATWRLAIWLGTLWPSKRLAAVRSSTDSCCVCKLVVVRGLWFDGRSVAITTLRWFSSLSDEINSCECWWCCELRLILLICDRALEQETPLWEY